MMVGLELGKSAVALFRHDLGSMRFEFYLVEKC